MYKHDFLTVDLMEVVAFAKWKFQQIIYIA